MRTETLRFLLVSLGFVFSLGIAGAALLPTAEAAISTRQVVTAPVVADEGADPDEEEGEGESSDQTD